MTAQSLVDPVRYLGSVSFVAASTIKANMPYATAHPEKRALSRGVVGDFVVVDCELFKLLGRIIEVGVPDLRGDSRFSHFGRNARNAPGGKDFDICFNRPTPKQTSEGPSGPPRVGDLVYLIDRILFGELVANALGESSSIALELGNLDAGASVPLRLRPENIFGRHCGIFGATGGGKSWNSCDRIV